jgi:tight adherence protein C
MGGDQADHEDRAVIDPALTGLAGACCCGVGLRGLVLMRSAGAVERRELQTEIAPDRRRRGPTRALLELLGRRFGPALLSRTSERGRERIRRRLDLAGRPGGMNVVRYAEVKAAALSAGVVLAVIFALLGSALASLLFLVAGWLVVDMWLSRTGRRRQAQLERDLPDLIDILAITVRAGVGYRAALERVARSLEGPPAEEILATLRQMELGATRREAFQALRERNNSRTLDNFVAAQLQAEELGVPLADALEAIAADTRRVAAQLARRRAQRATPRVTLVGTSLLLPGTILLIVVGLFIGSGVHIGHLLG